MTTLLFEDMIRAETATHVCRIWRQSDGPAGISNMDLKKLAEKMMQDVIAIPGIASELVKHERVNSVEVIDRHTGDGICVHKDWP